MPCSSCNDDRYCHDCGLCRHCDDDGHVDCEDSTEYHCPNCGYRSGLCTHCGHCQKHEQCLTQEEALEMLRTKFGAELVDQMLQLMKEHTVEKVGECIEAILKQPEVIDE